jgi:beta-phosphoglucomutase family hydrolase
LIGFMAATMPPDAGDRTGEIAGASTPRARDRRGMLQLPGTITTCLFDLDGVLTKTATLHAAAWKRTFDEFLAERGGEPFTGTDYDEYVDGRPRLDGVRCFLASRRIHAYDRTAQALAERKNDVVLALIRSQGVQRYEGSVRFAEAARRHGLRRAIVSSSANCRHVLEAAGIAGLAEAVVDGVLAEREHLAGKPAPDTFLTAAAMLHVRADEAAVFEDAAAGVQAGRAGGFGWVVAFDRTGHAEALHRSGADVVVRDLGELL